MPFIACGLNHKTAPLEIREKLALSGELQRHELDALLQLPQINEAAILSTCNRTEWYCDVQDPDFLLPWLTQHYQLPQMLPYLYLYTDQDAIKHMLQVASGLDSMMLGEPQILGQMKQTFQSASSYNAIGPKLHPIFQFIFGASKRIRNQSGVGLHATSVAYAATQLVSQHFAARKDLSVLLIGSGETASLVAKYLHQQGIQRFTVASRTQDNATELATIYNANTISINELHRALPKADVVVSATACPLPFISKSMVAQAMIERHQNPMFFLDLAVPRDIESAVKELTDVDLYNVDDLHQLTQHGMQQRQAAAQLANQLIALEMQQFADNHRVLRAKDVICDYRNTMEALADLELQRALQQLANGQSQVDVLTEFSQRLIKKFTHVPTLGLRQAALEQRDEILDTAHYLFKSNQERHEEIA